MKKMKNKKAAIIIILSIVSFVAISFFLREFISNYFVRLNLNTAEAPGKGAKLLVFAPHNDDETLGAGQLIKKTIKNGGKVKVVLITNGDGFKQAIQFDYFNLAPKPKDYINFGYTRQKETIKALKSFGISEDNIIFLGYPDGGIAYLWNRYLDIDNPYTSKYTESNKSPYINSYTKGASYTGQSIINDMSKIIMDYKPTHIVYPHSNDRHPDHWATNGFVKYTITMMNYKPEKEWLYLVHRGDWPVPMKKETKMYLVPPAKLIGIGTDWYAINMNENDINEKSAAIHSYKTQIKVLAPLLTAFERRNELLGEYKNTKLLAVNNINEKIEPNSGNQIILDPLQDSINLNISKGSDIRSIYLEEGVNKDLNIFLEVDGEIENHTKYDINSILFKNSNIKRLNLQIKNGIVSLKNISKVSIMNDSGIKSKVKGNVLHIIIPNNIIGEFNHIFISGNTSIEDRIIDKTAWRMVDR